MQHFYICRDVPVDIVSFFLISDYLAEGLRANKNQQTKSHIFQYGFAQETSLISRTLTHLTLKIVCSHNTAKKLSDFTNFPANMFLFGIRKNICTTPFLDAQELQFLKHFESKCLHISIYLLKKSFVSETQLRSYLVEGGMGGG